MIYTDKAGNLVYEGQQYVAPDGTKYPGNYPKSEIKELTAVKLAEKPSDGALVVTGFTVNEKLEQVWLTRPKTEEELNPPTPPLTLEQRVYALEAKLAVK